MPQVFHIEFTETAWEHLERYRPFEVAGEEVEL
jgi:hypothetical protein